MSKSNTQPEKPGDAKKRRDIQFAVKDDALRKDVHSLGNVVGELLLEQGGEALFKTVESARQLAIARRENDDEASAKLDKLLGKMSAAAARDIVRAFSTYFQVVNKAEQVHRIRRRRDYLKDFSQRQPRSLDATFALLNKAGFEESAAKELVQQITIEPVFTPHPTETTRRTILRKHQNIVRRMVDMQNPALTPQEASACFESVRSDITAIWQTEESPAEGATVFDELEHTLFFLTDVIYRVVPPFYEALSKAFREIYPDSEQFVAPNILHFSSWIGGDLSTDQEISARTIREALARQRSLLLDLYYWDCTALAEKLSQSVTRVDVDKGIKERIEKYAKQFPGVKGSTPHRYKDMPYRMLLRLMCQRLQATYDDSAFPYESVDQFIDDLKLIARSLTRRKGIHAGLFDVERLIRRAETFGFYFLSLDLRHNAEDLQTVVGYCLGDENWLTQTSEHRTSRLEDILEANDSPTIEPNNDAKRLFSVYGAISYCRRKYGDKSIGLFLVRHCRGVDDVLAALLLARWAGMFGTDGAIPLDVAPVFENGEELAIASDVVTQLLDNEFYKTNLVSRGTHQTVMLSNSGASTEDSVAASRWRIQQAHLELGALFQQADVDYTLFHGRGSFSDRGGVADSIACGHLRATEHGESINERYGVRGIAFRTLEKAFNAVTTATAGLDESTPDLADSSQIMEGIANNCDAAYGTLVQSNENFEEYSRLSTPVDVIEQMHVGKITLASASDETISRNIPWAFAWAQSRFLLPSWFGFGSALEQAFASYGLETLQSMNQEWPFFRRLVKDIETTIAIADLGIARHYSELAGSELHELFFPAIQIEYDRCSAAILTLQKQEILLENNNTLRRSIRLRNPYVDPMSLLQVELLRRWRAGNRKDEQLLTALLASVNGISRGLQTSV